MPRLERQPVSAIAGQSLALYVHVPFCETRCTYCDFNTFAGIESLIPAYADALEQEVSLWSAALSQAGDGSAGHQPIGTVFFGGGTPSYLPPGYIQRILSTIQSAFHLAADAEVTLESNPDDVTTDNLQTWKSAGVNRLSIGVQSLDDGLLQVMERRHDAEAARQAYHAARQAGFDNVNLDLMYGVPNQTLDQWRKTLSEALALGPEHLSLYCLTLEEGTPLEAWVRQGKVPEPDPDLAADMYVLAEDLAAGAGYEHYEISNWALPGRACRHNITYWKNQPYLGVGPGAHSYLNGYRFANLQSPQRYIKCVQEWSERPACPVDLRVLRQHGPVDTVEAIDSRLEMAETMMLGLRLGEGVSEEEFHQRFGAGIRATYGVHIQELEQLGLLEWREARLRLTSRGRLLGNEVFLRFFV